MKADGSGSSSAVGAMKQPNTADRPAAVVLTLVLVFYTLLSKEMGNVVLPATLPLIDDAVDGPVTSLLVSTGSLFYVGGKISYTLTVQAIGAKAVLVYSTLIAGTGLLLVGSAASGFTRVLIGTCLAQFGCAHVWGAGFGLVVGWVDRVYVGRVMGILFSTGSDGGGALGSLLVSVLIRSAGDGAWRWAFAAGGMQLLLVSALVQLILHKSAVAAGFAPPLLDDDSEGRAARSHPLDDASLGTAFGRLCFGPASILFWLTCLASIGYALAAMTMLTYATLYAVRRLHADAADAARVLTFASLGSLSGGWLGGIARDTLRGRALVTATAILDAAALAVACVWLWFDSVVDSEDGRLLPPLEISPAQCAHAMGAAMFLVFCSIVFSWNPIITLMQYKLGGAKHATTVVGIQDVLGFAGRVPFSYAFGLMLQRDESITAALCLWVLALALGHATTLAALILDELPAGAGATLL